MGVLLLIVGLALLMYLAYRGIPILIATLGAGVFVLVTAAQPILQGLTGPYMKGAAGYFQNYYLVFVLGALFGKIIEITGAAESIARGVLKYLGPKYVVTAVLIATAILCYGGVNLFVALFTIYPLAMSLFKQAGIPRRVFPAAYVAGCGTFAMTGPFTPAIQNVMPTKYLGTTVNAALIPGVIVALFQAAACIWYLQTITRKAIDAGETFIPRDTDVRVEEKDLPAFWISILPAIALLVTLNVFKADVVVAIFVGAVVALVVLYKYLPKVNKLWDELQKAGGSGVFSLVNTAAAVGFGTIVGSTPAFKVAANALLKIGGSPLIAAGIATTAMAGIAGSASGGLGIALPFVKEYVLPLGVNAEALHRVISVACGGLDSLPHNGFVITLLTVSGHTHKEAYVPIFVTTVLIPLISLALLIPLLYVFGMA